MRCFQCVGKIRVSWPEVIESVSPDRVTISVNLEKILNNSSENVANSEKVGANSEDNVSNSEKNVANSEEVGANRGEVGANLGEVGANRGEVGANLGEVGANLGEVGANRGEVGANISDTDSLISRNREVYSYISKNPYASITDICVDLGIAKRSVQRSLKELIDDQFVTKEGTRKKVHWIVLK